MKKRPVIIITLLTIILIQFIQAGGVGISPAYYKEFFEPGLEKTFTFTSFNADPTRGVDIYVKGDLAEYVNLSTTYLSSGGPFHATIKLPEEIKKPGLHTILIGVREAAGEFEETVGGIAAIQGRIDIMVPYPGKYAESTFEIDDINEGEDAKYEITSQNLGTETLKINTKIDIYKNNFTEKILTETFKESTLGPKELLTIKGALLTNKLPAGEYQAVAIIDWGQNDTIERKFRIGEFTVEIIDYDYQFERGKINPFNIQIQNKWNTKIEEVYATVSITDSGTLVGSFKTISTDTDPWEVKNLTGYFDTTDLKTKRYTARIELTYSGEKTSKLVAIYINNPASTIYRNYIIAGSILAALIIAAFTYLIWKVNILSKNAKKK